MTDAFVMGIDVGGTRIKAVAMTPDGAILRDRTIPTPPDLAQHFGSTLSALFAEVAGANRPAALGVVVPGIVDDRTGVAQWSANLGWRDLDVIAALHHLELPVAVGHDVRAGLVGEHRYGAARGFDDVLFVPLGTGLASAVMVGGRLVAGAPWSGEFGHIAVERPGLACTCGKSGCLETVVGGRAIGERWRRESGLDGDAETLVTSLDTNPVAQRIWAQVTDTLADAMAPLIAAIGTELVLLGGGLSRAGETLLAPLRDRLNANLPTQANTRIATADLGDQAGAIGSATLALDLLAR